MGLAPQVIGLTFERNRPTISSFAANGSETIEWRQGNNI